MPLIEVSVRRGRDHAQLHSLMRALHDAATSVLDVPDASVRVILHEVSADHWMAGGVTLAEAARQRQADQRGPDEGAR